MKGPSIITQVMEKATELQRLPTFGRKAKHMFMFMFTQHCAVSATLERTVLGLNPDLLSEDVCTKTGQFIGTWMRSGKLRLNFATAPLTIIQI